jgi:quercetin dioxygenase-like cupin family protein
VVGTRLTSFLGEEDSTNGLADRNRRRVLRIVVIGGAGLFGEKFAKKVYRKRDGGLERSPDTSLTTLGRNEMRFVTRSWAVFSVAIILLAAAGSNSLAQKRTPLQTINFPAGYEILTVIAELEPGSCTGRHSHPGAESAYVLEGDAVAKFDGKPDLILKAGQPLQFAPGEVHNVCNVGGGLFKALAHYIVEKGKPLVARAP